MRHRSKTYIRNIIRSLPKNYKLISSTAHCPKVNSEHHHGKDRSVHLFSVSSTSHTSQFICKTTYHEQKMNINYHRKENHTIRKEKNSQTRLFLIDIDYQVSQERISLHRALYVHMHRHTVIYKHLQVK